MSYPEFIVLNKKDGTGKVGIAVSKLASIEEVLGANTSTQYTMISVAQKTYTVVETVQEIMKALNFRHVGEAQGGDIPAGG